MYGHLRGRKRIQRGEWMSLEPALERFLEKGAAVVTGAGAHPSPHHRAVQLPQINSSCLC